MRSAVKKILNNFIQTLIAHSFSRRWLNALYGRLTFSQKHFVHRYFAKIFRDEPHRVDSGHWIVEFVGRQIQLPLRPEQIWLDWDSAVSILGHEIEVKQTYASLINSPMRPELFIDIGASYGTHSLLFLVHRIEAITFEPNVLCHEYFRGICALNGVESRIESVALGDSDGSVDLCYPEKDTWSGSTNNSVKRRLQAQHKLSTQRVEQKTLDGYLAEVGNRRLLIKIDTEGTEYQVLQGALRTLQINQPLVIFESLLDKNRRELFDLFASQHYRIVRLPRIQGQSTVLLNLSDFLDSSELNFIALPNKGNAA